MEKLQSFTNYVVRFYNDVDGVYPIASRKRIAYAVLQYSKENAMHYDSIDREGVRQILQPSYSPF